MKKVVLMSAVLSSYILAQQIDTIKVVKKIDSKVVNDVSSEEIKSADLSEALVKNVPSISLVRRSGIANDIILRGAKKDNINIMIDNSKIYGACPNRMDPATSHVLTNNIKKVELIEGPYDVEEFGTLSGKVKVETKSPKEGFNGDINLNVGSFSYKKFSTTFSGGTKDVKLLISASEESSSPYKDGNGNTFKEQQTLNGVPTSNQYKNEEDKAYEKKTLLSKLVYNIDNDSELRLSYTLNRSDNVLYPNTPMDADYDDSDIYTVDYERRNLGAYSKQLNLSYYYSKVDHPMSVRLRNNATMMKDMTNHMNSSIGGIKIKNSLEVNEALYTIGLDASNRNWKGRKFNNDLSVNTISLSSTDTKNRALFSKYEKTYGAFDLEVGARYDNTDIDVEDNSKKDNTYKELNAYVFSTFKQNEKTKYFFGFGKSSRVPDARELYYSGSGNENLKATKNYELDFGLENKFDMNVIKTKLFYSVLKDYIYNNNGTTFENIDAKIYGLQLSGTSLLSVNTYTTYGFAYQRGQKDEPLSGQTNKNLAEIPPLKANATLIYEFSKSSIETEVIAVKSWDKIDSDNGEQKLPGYALVNMKYKHNMNRNLEFILGVDNLFDKTYASTNTYNDIKYIGSGQSELINDPGRYIYTNIRIKF